MTRDDVQAWLGRYIAAWETYDEGAIGDLFTEDAAYRFHPSDEPIVGRRAIVASWVDSGGDASARDEPGTWEARYEPYVVADDRAVAIGTSRYFTDASRSTVRDVYDNAFLLEFGRDGRCRSFTELYVARPADRREAGPFTVR